jgi:SAM-dependent methyltransferase
VNSLPKPNATSAFSIEDDPFFSQDLLQMARAHNYRRWQYRMVAPYVRGQVLEVGGGIGNFTADLARTAQAVISLEPNAACHRQLLDKTRGLSNVKVYNAAAEDLDRHVSPGYLADSVVCMNVLEHLSDDLAAIRTFSRRLKAGGVLVLLIPAAPWAFGDIDRRLGHYRRYSKRSARALLEKCSLSVLRLRYFNFIGLWGWFWNTHVSRRQTQSDGQIYIFDNWIVPWQSRLESLVPPPIGQSLLAVARKEQN